MKAILQLCKVLTKLGVLNGRLFKDKNIGKYGKFVRNTKINQRKLPSCFIGTTDNKFEIVISSPRSREIFINCLISCGIGTKVTGNSTLRTWEKFGNTLFDGLRGGRWFAPILVRKGDYFLILCKKLFQNFNNCNYDQNSS